MNILLVNPPYRIAFRIPVGLGYVASVVREAGHNVRILDINALRYSREKVEELIRGFEFDLIGIGGLSPTYRYVKWLAGIIKKYKPHVPIVAGNMVSTAHPEALLNNSKVDIAVINEGEETFKELVSAINGDKDLKEVKGIFYKDNGNIIKTSPRPRISDLDSLPFPAWDLFPLQNYWSNSTESPVRFGLRSMMISTVRGCPYNCTFCSRPFGRTVYTRSPGSIIKEIKELKKRYRIECITSSDDLFLVDKEFVLEFCDRMISENLDVKWCAPGRVNLVGDNLLRKMRKAGCVELGYGFESGSQLILDRMKKRITVKQSEEAIKMTRRAGIKITGSFIFGMPGEMRETIRETVEFIKRTRLHLYRFFYATPYPATELYEIARTMGRLPEDEDKYLESLGEMRTTFLVNFTEFSDSELVRLKKLTELTVKRNLTFRLRVEGFIENWQRRFIVISQSLRASGFISTVKMISLKSSDKIYQFKKQVFRGQDKEIL